MNHRFERGSRRARDLMDLLMFSDHSQALEFSWQTVGKKPENRESAYKELSEHLKYYNDKRVHQARIQQKLKHLIQAGAPLLMDNDTYVSFYHMVQNEIKMNGKEKVVHLVDYALDGHIGSLQKDNQKETSISGGDTPKIKGNNFFRIIDRSAKLKRKELE